MNNKILLIDFDSTFVTVESLDLLAEIVLSERTDKQIVLNQIVEITKQGMEGKISFSDSLSQRLKLFMPEKKHLEQLIKLLEKKVTTSFERKKLFFKENAQSIYILSGGFKEYMVPVLKTFGIYEDHILGNTFLLDAKGNVIGYDKANMLAQEKGKVKMVEKMGFRKDVYMIGDGYTDWQVKEAGLAKKFIAYVGNIRRGIVEIKADRVASTFEEVLHYI